MGVVTGRRQQIRIHTAHVRHPTVCDSMYTDPATFQSDREWCPRNFLYRYRLTFADDSRAMQEAMAPLPSDLTNALETLEVRNSESAEWLQYVMVASESNLS